MSYWKQALSDWNEIFREELRTIFKDQGILIFFFVVPLVYPLLYTFIYTNEVVREVPIAVVDDSRSALSRDFLRHLDASPDVDIISYCANMKEAEQHIKHREAYGIIYVPCDFSTRLHRGEQVAIQAYGDMSGMLYYKSILGSATEVSLKFNARIKVERGGGTTAEQDKLSEHAIRYEVVSLYNPQNGFAAFLLPGVLILIIQQTLLLGVGMAAGTKREKNLFHHLLSIKQHPRGLLRIVCSKSLAYLLAYIPVSVYVLAVVPRMFQLNQIGNPGTLALFILPFLIACTFFAMTISGLIKHREASIVLIVFSSVPLLFISGISWPGSALPDFWKAVGYAFPSTFGINGFVAINSMGAHLSDVRSEWYFLWLQALVYFLTTCLVYRNSIVSSRKRHEAQLLEELALSKAKHEAPETQPAQTH